MRRYAAVTPQWWEDKTGRQLRKLGPVVGHLAMYLLTGPSATMTGMYFMPIDKIAYGMGYTEDAVREGLAALASIGYAEYDHDNEVVWVCDAALSQIGETVVPKDNRHGAIVKELSKFAGTPLHARWLERYATPYRLTDDGDAEHPSGGGTPTPPKPMQDQEQEQGQEQSKITPTPPSRARESAPPAPVREAPPSTPRPVAAAAVSASPSQPGEQPTLRRLATASGGRYDWRSGSRALRTELAERLATYKPTDALIDRMGALLQTPLALWPWATKLGDGYVTTQWLLGAKSTDGEREAAMLSDLVGKAKAALRAEMEANARREAAKAQWEAARVAQAEKAAREADPAWQEEQRQKREAAVASIRAARPVLAAQRQAA